MSNSRDFDYYSQKILDTSAPKDGQPQEKWLADLKAYLRMVFRAGTQARLEHGYRQLDDSALARVRWLADQDFVNSDVKALLAEVEDQRARAGALRGSYGVTDADIRSMLGEGFHTAFRKAVDHPYATTIWQLIKDLPGEDWAAVLDFVTEPITSSLRRAQEAAVEKAAAGQ